MADDDGPFRARVQVFEEYADQVSEDWVLRASERALAKAAEVGYDRGAAGVVVANDDTVRALNRAHRGLDETTDVLAFSNISEGRYYGDDRAQSLEPADGFAAPPEQDTEFGEVVISYPQAVRQAGEAGHSVKKELATLLAHGLLHLLGYDHEDPEEEAEMAARQEALLVEVLEV